MSVSYQIILDEIKKAMGPDSGSVKVANESWVQASLPAAEFTGLNTLSEAGPREIAFFFSKHYESELKQTRAGLIVTAPAFAGAIEASGLTQWKTSIFVSCSNPYVAMAKLTEYFSKVQTPHDHTAQFSESEIHPTAVVHPTAKILGPVKIGAGVVIEAGAEIHPCSVIYPQCYVGTHCVVGTGTVLFPRVTLYAHTRVGARCRIHSGAVIGADGFGYAPKVENKLPVDHYKIFHLGGVEIGDDVEIGANSTIDRGTLGNTVIQSKVKIDNLVQVGHNCSLGEGTIVCGCAGMAGSSSTGKFVVIGAQSGTANQVHLGDYAKLAAYTGAAKDVEPMAEVGGVPARDLSDYYKILAIQNKLLRERSK